MQELNVWRHQWDDSEELCDFLESVGAKFIIDPEESSSNDSIVDIICAGATGPNWQVVHEGKFWYVSGTPGVNLWVIGSQSSEVGYTGTLVALG